LSTRVAKVVAEVLAWMTYELTRSVFFVLERQSEAGVARIVVRVTTRKILRTLLNHVNGTDTKGTEK